MIRAGEEVKVAPHRGYHEVKAAIKFPLTVLLLFDPNPEIPESVRVPLTAAVPVLSNSIDKPTNAKRQSFWLDNNARR